MMKIFRVDLPKSKLSTMPEDEQVFFVQITHFLNELCILQKSIIISSNGLRELNTIERKALISQTLFFIKILAGKLNEGWNMLGKNFFGTHLSKIYEDSLPEEGKDALSELKRYFGGENIVKLIRDKFAFHYDKENIKEGIDTIPNEEVLEMYLHEYRGNCLFSFSDDIVNMSILSAIDTDDMAEAMDKLVAEVAIDVVGWFQGFGGECIAVIGKKLELEHSEVEISEPPLLDDLKVPYFIKKTV